MSTQLVDNEPFMFNSASVAAIGITAGAFGAHGLRKRAGITPDNIHAWETASHYAVGVYSLEGLALDD